MLGALTMLAGIAWFVLLIILLIKQFQYGGVMHGIVGVFTCGLWTYLWGWINSSELKIRNLMIVWTIIIVLYLILMIRAGGLHFLSGNTPGL